MKTSAVIKLIVNAFTASVLIFVLIFCLNAGSSVSLFPVYRNYSGYTVCNEKTVVINEDIVGIDIEWTAGNVTVKRGEEDTVTFGESPTASLDEDELMLYKIEDNVLKIRFCKKTESFTIGINTNTLAKTLNLTVPEKIYESIDIETVSAGVEMTGISASVLDIESVSGIVSLDNCTASHADIETVSGNCTARLSTFDTLDASTVSAQMNISADISESGDFESVSGNITLSIPSDSSFRAEFSTVSGIFDSDFSTMRINDVYTCGDRETDLYFETVSGSVNIEKR